MIDSIGLSGHIADIFSIFLGTLGLFGAGSVYKKSRLWSCIIVSTIANIISLSYIFPHSLVNQVVFVIAWPVVNLLAIFYAVILYLRVFRRR